MSKTKKLIESIQENLNEDKNNKIIINIGNETKEFNSNEEAIEYLSNINKPNPLDNFVEKGDGFDEIIKLLLTRVNNCNPDKTRLVLTKAMEKYNISNIKDLPNKVYIEVEDNLYDDNFEEEVEKMIDDNGIFAYTDSTDFYNIVTNIFSESEFEDRYDYETYPNKILIAIEDCT